MKSNSATVDQCLHDFGHRCGADGHSLEDSSAWLSIFTESTPATVRTELVARRAAIQLASGWIDGYNARQATAAIDHFGVAALKTRLHQEYDRLAAFGLCAVDELSLVVLESAERKHPVPTSVIAAVAHQHFRFGETIAECSNGRVIVLTDRTTDLAAKARRTAARADLAHGGRRGAVTVWIEGLGEDRITIDDFLDELTC